MILNACTVSPGTVRTTFKPFPGHACRSKASCVPDLASYLKIRSQCGTNPGRHVSSSGGIQSLKYTSSSASLPKSDYGLASFVPFLLRYRDMKSSRHMSPPRASKDEKAEPPPDDVPKGFRYPEMTGKPSWFWRALSCIPYLMPLHETWMYAETAFSLHPLLEDFEFFTYRFLVSLSLLPEWFLMGYFFFAYLGVVRRKEWPHFFRYNVIMGMLLEIALQVFGTISRWMPIGVYWGKFGMHFWTAICFAYLFTVLLCIRCAIWGAYADVPFASDAAYIQIPYD